MGEKFKIAYVLHGLASGGTENFIFNVAKELDKEKYDINIILAVDNDSKQFLEDDILKLGVKIYKVCDLDGLRKKLRYFKSLYRLLKNDSYEIIHANMDLLNGLILLIAKVAGIRRRICHSHISHSQYAVSNFKKIIVLPYQVIMRFLIKNFSTKKIGCSDLANNYLYGSKYGNSNKPIVLYNGVQLSRFKSPNMKQVNYIKECELKHNCINIVTVGRISSPKNPFLIVEIIYEICKLRRDVNFVWIGKGELESEVKGLIDKYDINNHFTFLGVRKDIAEILNCCDYFLFPSLFEGLGISLIEAQAANLDCFISDTIPKAADVGKCIALPLGKSSKYWAEQINEYINSGNTKEINMNNLSQFDIKNTVRQLEKIYIGNI